MPDLHSALRPFVSELLLIAHCSLDLENVVVYAPSWLHKPSWLRVDVENVVYDALKSAL